MSLGVVLCQDWLYYTPVHVFVAATLSFEVQHLLLEMSVTSCLYIYVLLGSSLPNMCMQVKLHWRRTCLTPKASAAATRMWTGLYEIIASHAGWGFCAEKLTIISQNPSRSIASGEGKGQSAPPWQRKNCQKSGKKRDIQEKRKYSKKGKNLGRKGKNWEGSFTLPILIDRAGYATAKGFLKNHRANKRLAFTNLSAALMQNSNIEMNIWLLNFFKNVWTNWPVIFTSVWKGKDWNWN